MPSQSDILLHASQLRSGIPCRFADEDPRSGGSHKVFKIIFEDSVQWAARTSEDDLWKMEMRAMEHFQHLKREQPGLKAPNVFFLEEFPVLYSEWVPGEPLSVWRPPTMSDEQRRVFLGNLAKVFFDVWKTSSLKNSDAGHGLCYSEWLVQSLDRGLRRTLSGTAQWGHAIDYLIMRSMIPKYAANLDIHTGVSYAHGDMNAFNFMVDSDFRLTGVVDWDWMYAAPLPAVIHHPWFIADIPGWNSGAADTWRVCSDDRRWVEYVLKLFELNEGIYDKSYDPVIWQLLAGSRDRFFFQSSFHFKGIHEAFVEMHCHKTRTNVLAAKTQLDQALELYPELKSATGTQETISLIESLL